MLEAYPNAELGQTILFARFPQSVTGAVQVTIHDGQGQERAEVAGSVERGSAMLVWDGKAADGSACEPGSYVARMRGPEQELSASFEVPGI